MKKVFIILILFSCKKPDLHKEGERITLKESSELTAANTYNLYIPEDESGWDTPDGKAGLFNEAKSVSYTNVNSYLYDQYLGKIPLNTRVKICVYGCPIANSIPGNSWDTTANNPITRSGANDYVTQGGIQPNPLSITVYSKGDVYLGRKKDEFYYLPTTSRIGAAKGMNYGDKSFIWWGWMDQYRNSAIIPDEDGLFVIAVTLDYGGINPVTSLLPVKVVGSSIVTDTTAIEFNKANPATNYKATLQRGKVKGVNISWEGNGYAYCIMRDGEMIVRWQDIRNYFDPGGNRFSRYKIITRAQGRIPDAETPEFKATNK